MRRIRILTAAGAIIAAVAVISFMLSRTLTVREPIATVTSAKVVESALITGTLSSRQIPVQVQPQAPSASAPTVASLASATAFPIPNDALPRPACGNPDPLGVARVVEIDTAGGPGFGFEQFKAYDFLREREVVLTFDDGPWPGNTQAVLKALADQCTKALFFPIGKHAMWHPEILKQVVAAGHTVGSHSWSHADLSKLTIEQAKGEFEKGASAVRAALGTSEASFFRFPGLRNPPEMLAYLGTRNIGIFSTDMDSFDFKSRKPEQVIVSVIAKLKKRGKGIVLLHDFQHPTSLALPELLAQLKANGYKIVQVKSKDPVTTLPEYDDAIVKEFGSGTVSARPTASVVRTVSE
jgi:peptidoglycan/xylan/chitin deacetylase (PgdA/CDA1 family)